MFTALDNNQRSCDSIFDNSAFERPRSGRHAATTSRRLRRLFLVCLLIQAIGCVAPEDEVGRAQLAHLTSNSLTPEELTDNISAASALIDSGLLDDEHVLDQTAASAVLATIGGQQFLQYAITCALPGGESVTNPGNGPGEFVGNLGLAPAWKQRGLTPSERRALSACMLAHVNAFGEYVSISIRNPVLVGVEPGETAQYEFYEATFYGDLFAPVPAMYVCAGQPAPGGMLDMSDDDRAQRVCSDSPAPGSSETLCGFERIGSCTDVCDTSVAGSHSDCWNNAARNDTSFSETLSVWLSIDDA